MLNLDTQLWVMAVMGSGLCLLRCILSPMCRYSTHWFVQYGTTASYHLHLPLALYAVNTVCSSSECKGHHILLCYSLVLSVFVNINLYSSASMFLLTEVPCHGSTWLVKLCYIYCLWSLTSKLNDGANELTTRSGLILVYIVSFYSSAVEQVRHTLL